MRPYFDSGWEPVAVAAREPAERVVTYDAMLGAIDILAQLWADVEADTLAQCYHRDFGGVAADIHRDFLGPLLVEEVNPAADWLGEVMEAVYGFRDTQMAGVPTQAILLPRLPPQADERLSEIGQSIRCLAGELVGPPSQKMWHHRHLRELSARLVGAAVGRIWRHAYARTSYTTCEVSMWSTGFAAQEGRAADRRERLLQDAWTARYVCLDQWIGGVRASAAAWVPPTSFFEP